MSSKRGPYSTDVSDEEWAGVAPSLTLLSEDAGQRRHDLREVYNGARYLVKTGAHGRTMPHDLPPWPVVYQQTRRWLAAGCFETIIHDLRSLLRRAHERPAPPTAVILDSRTLQSTPERGARAGYDGHKRRKGSKAHVAVDTLGDLLAAFVTPADEQDRAQVEQLAAAEVAPGVTFGERFPTSLAPSARSLLRDAASHTRARERRTAGVAALGDPRVTHQPLAWGEAEALTVAKLARTLGLPAEARVQQKATHGWLLNRLADARLVDASCHGFFNSDEPLDSSLALAGAERPTPLALRELLNQGIKGRACCRPCPC